MHSGITCLSYRFAGFMIATGLIFDAGNESAAADDKEPYRQYVQLSVIGKYNAARNSVTAEGKPKNAAAEFVIDFGKSPQLVREAEALDVKTVSIRGALVQCSNDGQKGVPKCDRDRNRNGLFLQPVSIQEFQPKSGAASAKDHGVSVVCRGLIHTDVVAIGGETTGVTIEVTPDGEQSWELELQKDDLEVARKANGSPIIVSGTVEVRKGTAIRERWIVTVRNLGFG